MKDADWLIRANAVMRIRSVKRKPIIVRFPNDEVSVTGYRYLVIEKAMRFAAIEHSIEWHPSQSDYRCEIRPKCGPATFWRAVHDVEQRVLRNADA
jgi:hypothetical protein